MAGFGRRVTIGALAVTAGLALAGWRWMHRAAGAGALHQFAPAQVQPGAPFEIKVLAGVWGSGREASVRYHDWSLQLLHANQPVGSPVRPARVEREGERIALFFALRAPPQAAASASLTWEVRFEFDGQPHRVAGPHSITISP